MRHVQFGRPMPARPEAPDQAAKLEALHKKLLSEMKSSQSTQLKTLREDMRKETKRIETATQAQVPVQHTLSLAYIMPPEKNRISSPSCKRFMRINLLRLKHHSLPGCYTPGTSQRLKQLLGCLQVTRLVQMQKETLADERAIVLGEHKAELKTLVSVMSASINRDLPARIEEMIGRAVGQLLPVIPSDDGCKACAAAAIGALRWFRKFDKEVTGQMWLFTGRLHGFHITH